MLHLQLKPKSVPMSLQILRTGFLIFRSDDGGEKPIVVRKGLAALELHARTRGAMGIIMGVFSLALITGAMDARDLAFPQGLPETTSFSFEVAAIKRTKADGHSTHIQIEPGGRLMARAVTLRMLIEKAYGVKASQIVQGPQWFDSERYDIDAKPGESESAIVAKLPPLQQRDAVVKMLQSLLAERFRLALGHRTREISGYALLVAKNGPRFSKSSYNPPAALTAAASENRRQPRPGISFDRGGRLTMTYGDLTMLANALSDLVGRIVVDKTGLSDKYDLSLHWAPEQENTSVASDSANSASPPESDGPSITTAIQEQLGLKLQSQKVPVNVLVIEHVERPSEN